MKKLIAVCFALWCAIAVSAATLFGLILMGPVLAVVWGLIGAGLALPVVYDVMAEAWKPETR